MYFKKICRLCLDKEATKKNSHIISHFLIKEVDNQEGYTTRDRELGFIISSEKPTKGYFGASLLPETLNEMYGNISDEDIENSKSPLIKDYILCPDCEKYLAEEIESKYADHLTGKKNTQDINFKFWCSIIWRLSIIDKINISDENENSLRQIVRFNNPSEHNFHYFLCECEDYNKDKGSYFITEKSDKPINTIYIYLWKYILVFCFDGKVEINNLYDIIENLSKENKNDLVQGENIIKLTQIKFEEIRKNIINNVNKDNIKNIERIVKELYDKLLPYNSNNVKLESIQKDVINRIINSKYPEARRYSEKHILECLRETIPKYFIITL